MDNNICLFVPKSGSSTELHTVNFVLETKGFPSSSFINDSIYRMMLVKNGSGTLQTPGDSYPLSEGDIFFCIPSLPYFIDHSDDFEYMYISYLGPKTNMIMDRLGINRKNLLFHGFNELIQPWLYFLKLPPTETTNLKTESLLLYSFSVLGDTLIKSSDKSRINDAASVIKKYVDDHYFDSELSLTKISKELSFSSKYVSSVFKKNLKINLFSYLNTLRIQHACTFMDQNLTSIKDISYMCGFNDQLYFTKVFKSLMGITPKEYIAEVKKK